MEVRAIAGVCGAAMLIVAFQAPWHASQIGVNVQSSWTRAQVVDLHDSAAFRRDWSKLFPLESRRPALPVIDFTAGQVVFVAAGSRPTGGFRLDLDHANVVHDTAVISVTLFTPPVGCGVTEALTAPAMAIALPATPRPFRIITRERRDTARCN